MLKSDGGGGSNSPRALPGGSISVSTFEQHWGGNARHEGEINRSNPSKACKRSPEIIFYRQYDYYLKGESLHVP